VEDDLWIFFTNSYGLRELVWKIDS